MDNSAKRRKPTPAQLSHLRSLAVRRGQSFAWPVSEAQAREEIARLRRAPKPSGADRRRERAALGEDLARERGGAARVREEEISGYGSTAHWS